VTGVEFSAAAVAAGVEAEVGEVEEQCAELARREQFLRSHGAEEWPDGTVATRYGFLHALYQEVLYHRLTARRRQRLHQRIGEREEAAYGDRAGEMAAELALKRSNETLALAQALATVHKTGHRYYEVELHRLKGELLPARSRRYS